MKKNVAVITAIPSEQDFPPYYYELQNAAQKFFGCQLHLLKNGEFCYRLGCEPSLSYQGKSFDIQDYDLALVRFGVRASHGADFYVVRCFESAGIPTINPTQATTVVKDKLQTLAIFQQAQVAIPETVVIRQREQVEYALESLSAPPYIIKTCFGSEGKTILQASTTAQVYAIFDYAWHIDRNEILLLQNFVPTQPVTDVRTICLHGEPWRSMVRTAKEGEFRANVSKGAVPSATCLTEEEIQVCRKVAKAFSLPLIGIDFLRTEDGPVFLEVNGCPGLKGMSVAYREEESSFWQSFLERIIN